MHFPLRILSLLAALAIFAGSAVCAEDDTAQQRLAKRAEQ